MYPTCDECRNWGVESPHEHIEIDVEGVLSDEDFEEDIYSVNIEAKV
jgi:hypothetical protein